MLLYNFSFHEKKRLPELFLDSQLAERFQFFKSNQEIIKNLRTLQVVKLFGRLFEKKLACTVDVESSTLLSIGLF